MSSSGVKLISSLMSLFLLLTAVAAAAVAEQSMDLLMPKVAPKAEDTYLCTAMRLDSDKFIKEFNPQHKSGHAHHIILTACEQPGSTEEKVWNCGEMLTKSKGAVTPGEYKVAPQCASGTRIIYAYAMDAPALTLPEGVTFGVGPKFGLTWLVVQVHYKSVASFAKDPSLKDSSGVKMTYQTVPSPKLGGVYLSVTDGEIPAHSVTHLEASCSYNGQATLHPFAFRTHTHSLGRVVSGYRVRDGHWTLIGTGNPQEPQMFYPVNGTGTVKPGDQLAAKCVMENTGDKDVSIGATQKDEMCNFYMMYWIPSADVGKDGDHMCFADGQLWEMAPKAIAEMSATIPGTGKMLKEFNREMERMDGLMEQMLEHAGGASEMDMPEFGQSVDDDDFLDGPDYDGLGEGPEFDF